MVEKSEKKKVLLSLNVKSLQMIDEMANELSLNRSDFIAVMAASVYQKGGFYGISVNHDVVETVQNASDMAALRQEIKQEVKQELLSKIEKL